MASQTWFGCGCSFVCHEQEKYCKDHKGKDYYFVWREQIGWKEMEIEFKERLEKAMIERPSMLREFIVKDGKTE